jgi:hypothetical protein
MKRPNITESFFMYRSVPLCPEFFGPQMALAYRLDAISQGPKTSRFPGPNPLPLALVMDAARIKSITNRAAEIIGA